MSKRIQRTIDFNKVQWADFYYSNQDGLKFKCKPRKVWTSVHGCYIKPDELAPAWTLYPNETLLERAKRLQILDRWHPVCVLVFTANKHLRYTGKGATKIWKSYNAHIYGK